jgi:HEAT repeat protein
LRFAALKPHDLGKSDSLMLVTRDEKLERGPPVWVRRFAGAVVALCVLGAGFFAGQRFQVPQTDKDRRVQKFTTDLSSPDVVTRLDAARSLGAIGAQAEGAVPALVESIKDEEESVRLAAVEALGGLGRRAAPAVPTLIQCLDDASLGAKAAWALKMVGPQAIPPLIEMLASSSETVRWLAAEAIGDIQSREAVSVLVELLHHERREVREAAAMAIGRMSSTAEDAAVDLAAVLERPDILTPAAVAAVGSLGRRAVVAVPQLMQILLETDDPPLRSAARESLRNLGFLLRDHVPQLLEALSSEDTTLRRAAAEVLGRVYPAPSEAVARLVASMQDPDREVRLAATRSLGLIGAADVPTALPALVSALRDTDTGIRVAAATALIFVRKYIDQESLDQLREAVPHLLDLVADDQEVAVRRAARSAIMQIAPERLVERWTADANLVGSPAGRPN